MRKLLITVSSLVVVALVCLGAASIDYNTYMNNAIVYTNVMAKTATFTNGITAGASTFTGGVLVSGYVTDTNNVVAFGAVGDGVTDDTTAFQNALNAGKTVGVPYSALGYVVSNLTVTNSVRFFGLGSSPKLIFKAGSSNVMLNCGTNSNIRIENLEFDGLTNTTQKATVSAGTRTAIQIDGYGTNNIISKCYIHGFGNQGIYVYGNTTSTDQTLVGGPNLKISDTIVMFCFAAYDFADSRSEYQIVTGSRAYGCKYGFRVLSASFSIGNCQVTECGNGIYLSGNGNDGHGNVTGCTINHCTYSLFADVSNGCSIVGNQMWGGILWLNQSSNMRISGNVLALAEYRFYNGYLNTVENNSVYAGYGNTITHNYGGSLADKTILRNNTFQDGSQLSGSLALSGSLFTSTNSVVVTNTVAESSLLGTGWGTKTIPANLFEAGRTMRVTVRGLITATNNPTLTINVKVGTNVVCTTGAITVTVPGGGTIANNTFSVSADVTCRTAPAAPVTLNATGNFIGSGMFFYDASSNGGKFAGISTTTSSDFNLTIAQAVDVTATWGTADANNVLTGQTAVVEFVN